MDKQLLRQHSEEESEWSDGESDTELGKYLKLSQEFERQACSQSRHGRLNDDQEREARLMLQHKTIELSWLLSHLKRDKTTGKLRVLTSVKDYPQSPELYS